MAVLRTPRYQHVIKRYLHLHEYQSKALLENHGVNTQPFAVAGNVKSLTEGCNKLKIAHPHHKIVIKAQVLAGGRGKGHFANSKMQGGVKIVDTIEDTLITAESMLNDRLVTIQTPPHGVLVKKVMLAKAVNIVHEAYFAILIDRESRNPVLIASSMGGVDIETVAHNNPECIHKMFIDDIDRGPTDGQLDTLAQFAGFSPVLNVHQQVASLTGEHFPITYVVIAVDQMKRLYKMFVSVDALQIEINPLALTSENQVMAIDAKIQFDDNAAFRQKDLFTSYQIEADDHFDQRECAASKHSLNYISLDGNVGCLVNGAGLAMATMDVIKEAGGSPANFLDVGGSATEEQVRQAFLILTSDPKVASIYVNIFGGIMKCDTIASGIVKAAGDANLELPLVVRLAGTRLEEAKTIISESSLPIILVDDMFDGARMACQCAKENSGRGILQEFCPTV